MDEINLIGGGAAGGGLGAGLAMLYQKWITDRKMSQTDGKISQVEKDLSDHKLESLRTFSTKDDFKVLMDAIVRHYEVITTKIDKLDDKLDRKVDK